MEDLFYMSLGHELRFSNPTFSCISHSQNAKEQTIQVHVWVTQVNSTLIKGTVKPFE